MFGVFDFLGFALSLLIARDAIFPCNISEVFFRGDLQDFLFFVMLDTTESLPILNFRQEVIVNMQRHWRQIGQGFCFQKTRYRQLVD